MPLRKNLIYRRLLAGAMLTATIIAHDMTPIGFDMRAHAAKVNNAIVNDSDDGVFSGAMVPVHQASFAIPTSRPDKALYYGTKPVDIEIPQSKPALDSIFPVSTARLGDMIRMQTGQQSDTEADYQLKSGDGLANVLRRAGYSNTDIANSVTAIQTRISLRTLPVGMNITISDLGYRFTTRDGRDIYALKDPESGWLALRAIRPVDTYLTFANGVINGSIYKSTITAGVPDAAFNEYVRVMGFSVDFQREIRKGDVFELLYETSYDQITGNAVSTKLHYAGLKLSGNQLAFYRYENSDAGIGWFDRDGASAARTLIRTPISGARLSSSFGKRKHPVNGYTAMHKGVDFAAPTGTPIIAAGSGVVREAGWRGSFGRYVRIRHNSTYDTAYAHMKSIARGVRAGSRVQQGQVIGYVGSTGRSTGPHLHYEILVNNRQVNPVTVRLPTGTRLDEAYLPAFLEQVDIVDAEVLSRGNTEFAQNNLKSAPGDAP
ncbi:peptidoglycan DD-metalloendopeptidase family protein [Alphaproteobacteria bacterium]|nr:peptidoglycan DD-metalloendopeptidase family protein [Alphaproteobacteria bacterium]